MCPLEVSTIHPENTGYDLADLQGTNNNIFYCFVQSKPVILETSRTATTYGEWCYLIPSLKTTNFRCFRKRKHS